MNVPLNPDGKYALVFMTDPLLLTETEVAALVAMTTLLLSPSKLPGYDPTDVTLTLTFGRTGHTGSARMELVDKKKGSA